MSRDSVENLEKKLSDQDEKMTYALLKGLSEI